jgi:hypothetical protein
MIDSEFLERRFGCLRIPELASKTHDETMKAEVEPRLG